MAETARDEMSEPAWCGWCGGSCHCEDRPDDDDGACDRCCGEGYYHDCGEDVCCCGDDKDENDIVTCPNCSGTGLRGGRS